MYKPLLRQFRRFLKHEYNTYRSHSTNVVQTKKQGLGNRFDLNLDAVADNEIDWDRQR
jgi:hypothetical protein